MDTRSLSRRIGREHNVSCLVSDNLHWQQREAWIYSKHAYTRYPFQAATFGLPTEVVKECLLGAIEARYKGGGNTAFQLL